MRRGASATRDGDAGAGQVDDVGRRLKDVRRRGECPDDSGSMELAESAVDGVLGEKLEVLGDLAGAGLDDESSSRRWALARRSWRMTRASAPCWRTKVRASG